MEDSLGHKICTFSGRFLAHQISVERILLNSMQTKRKKGSVDLQINTSCDNLVP